MHLYRTPDDQEQISDYWFLSVLPLGFTIQGYGWGEAELQSDAWLSHPSREPALLVSGPLEAVLGAVVGHLRTKATALLDRLVTT